LTGLPLPASRWSQTVSPSITRTIVPSIALAAEAAWTNSAASAIASGATRVQAAFTARAS